MTTHVKNRGDKPSDAVICVALYGADGRFLGMKIHSGTLAAGVNTLTLNNLVYEGAAKASTAKCFVFETMDSVKPISKDLMTAI